MDDLVGAILFDSANRGALMDVLKRARVPDLLKAILSNKQNTPLQQALRIMPNSDELLVKLNDVLGRLPE